MSIVTRLPNVSAQSRAFISGRLKSTWHGDLRYMTRKTYTVPRCAGSGNCKQPRTYIREGEVIIFLATYVRAYRFIGTIRLLFFRGAL